MKSGSGYTPANDCPNNLRKYRELKGLTISGLAEILGADKSTVSQYETGSTEIKERRRIQLGHIFNLPADDFLPKCFPVTKTDAVSEGQNEPSFKDSESPLHDLLGAIHSELRQIKGILAERKGELKKPVPPENRIIPGNV